MGQLLKFADGWGLTEWSPPGFRPSADRAPKPKKKAKKKKAKAARVAEANEQSKPATARQAGDQAATEMATNVQEMPKAS